VPALGAAGGWDYGKRDLGRHRDAFCAAQISQYCARRGCRTNV
jgi:hypothetical protein